MHLIRIKNTWFTQQRLWGLYQNKVTAFKGQVTEQTTEAHGMKLKSNIFEYKKNALE